MFKVIYHYEIEGVAKSFVAFAAMTLDQAKEYILEQFDRMVDESNEEETLLEEGRHAEILREVAERNYEIIFEAA